MKHLAVFIIAVGILTFETRVSAQITRLNKTVEQKISKPRRKNEVKILQKIMENNKKLSQLLKLRSSVPLIWEGGTQILTGRVFRGIVLNSIVSTNLSSPVLVEAMPDQGLPYRTKFSCSGTTQNKRVFTLCSKMITKNKEVPVVAQILNIDGSSGLLGEYDDAKEDLIAGAVISDFSQGVLSAAQTRFAGPLGSVTDSSSKNQILQGFVESGKTTSDILLEEMKTKEPVVTVNSGEEVLIYFMEAVNEY